MKQKQKGFSLLEVLVSCSLTSMLMLGFMGQYHLMKRSALKLERVMLQEADIQTFIEEAKHSIRHAGFTPCMRADAMHVQGAKRITPISIDATEPATLKISRMSEQFAVINQSPFSQHELHVDTPLFHSRQRVLITDCVHSEIQTIHQVQGKQGGQVLTFHRPLSFQYQTPAYMGLWIEEQYQLKTNADGRKILYYCDPHCEALSEDVTDLTWKKSSQHHHGFVQGKVRLNDGTTTVFQARLRN